MTNEQTTTADVEMPDQMNVELFDLVKAHIAIVPERLEMGDWVCETAACIAGWGALLSGRYRLFGTSALQDADGVFVDGESAGVDVFGLTYLQGRRLFYLGSWPWEFREAWSNATDAAERAQIACERIDHFIATGGAE